MKIHWCNIYIYIYKGGRQATQSLKFLCIFFLFKFMEKIKSDFTIYLFVRGFQHSESTVMAYLNHFFTPCATNNQLSNFNLHGIKTFA